MHYLNTWFRFIFIVLFVLTQSRAYAVAPDTLPQGGVVVDGAATLAYSTDKLQVNQTSDRAIIDYNSFSVGYGSAVNFSQPNASSVTLNRVTGGSASNILGSMTANGQIFLINPNGIIFGNLATVDASALVASTLNISNADFMSGNYNFTNSGTNGSIINQAQLSTLSNPGGFVALLSKYVLNAGTIQANLGSVALASGNAVTLNLDPAGIVSVVINEKSTGVGSTKTAGVDNLGTLKANGGKVLLTADVLNTVFDNAINNDGIIEAKTIGINNGKVVLTGNTDVLVGGDIEGGDVTIVSTEGDVVQKLAGTIKTNGGALTVFAGNDYVMKNGVVNDTAGGAYDVSYGGEWITGSAPEDTDTVGVFNWSYVEGSRDYQAIQFGYYLNRDGVLIYVPLVTGKDWGKDGVTPLSGSGRVYADLSELPLYVVFKGWAPDPGSEDGSWSLQTWTYHTDRAMNADEANHAAVKGNLTGWEDTFGGGDQDMNDVIHTFSYSRKGSDEDPVYPDPTPDPVPALRNISGLEKYIPIYYQNLFNNQLRNFVPINPTGLYFYHPLTLASGADYNDQIDLSADAFNFIEEELKKKQ